MIAANMEPALRHPSVGEPKVRAANAAIHVRFGADASNSDPGCWAKPHGVDPHPWAAQASANARVNPPCASAARCDADWVSNPSASTPLPGPPARRGAIASGEARPDPWTRTSPLSPSTQRAAEPGMKARARHTERPADPRERPDPLVLRNQGEPHIEFLGTGRDYLRDIALHLELGDLTSQLLDLELLGLRLPMPGEGSIAGQQPAPEPACAARSHRRSRSRAA